MQTKQQAFEKLEKAQFRASFYLSKKDRQYIEEKGMDVIRHHAEDFVRNKLSAKEPANDCRQTPMSGHPVFKAMHGCACCCRGCLHQWYNVPIGVPLSKDQQKRIVDFLMFWIEAKTKH